MNPDSTLAVTQTCPKDGVHLWLLAAIGNVPPTELEQQYYLA